MVRVIDYLAHDTSIMYVSSFFSGKLRITGNELPLIAGSSRTIVCTWDDIDPIAKIEWLLQTIPLISTSNSRVVTLYLDQSTIGLDATTFVCRATDTHGDIYVDETTVQVKGNVCGTSVNKFS